MVLEEIIGGAVAVIVAGMPAMIALLKINQLHLAVNSRMDKFIEATLSQNQDRAAAMLSENESRVADIAHSRDLLMEQNTQLIEHLAKDVAELIRQIDTLPCAIQHVADGSIVQEKPPCTV